MLFGPRKEARAALLTSWDHGTVSLNSPLPLSYPLLFTLTRFGVPVICL